MKKIIKSLRGIDDIYPPYIYKWVYVENIIKNILISYGYNEIRLPILEHTNLFKHIIGNETELVNKEMYSFYDKHNNNITLRPEGTSSCARAIIENDLWHNNEYLKFWYYGPMFRYERPQKGRLRQFYQLGIEIYGIKNIEIDIELILIIHRIFKKLGLINHITLEINNLGTIENRLKFNQIFLKFLKKKFSINLNYNNLLDKLINNPFKLYDKKYNNPNFKKILEDSPKLINYIDESSKENFNKLCFILNSLGIKFTINNNLVRGLNYYTGTVFEWKAKKYNFKNTICAGGRYDSLINQIFKQKIPAIGLAIGIERLILLINKVNPSYIFNRNLIHILFIMDNNLLLKIKGIKLIEKIKNNINNIKILISYKKKLKKHLSFANKIDAILALIYQKPEIDKKIIIIKDLENNKQYIVPIKLLINELINILNKKKYI